MNAEIIIVNFVFLFLFLAWIGFGSWLSYKNRNAEYGIKIILAVLFTKGFFLFWMIYWVYILVKNFRDGMKEGQTDKGENSDEVD